jgi:hypothetical protein
MCHKNTLKSTLYIWNIIRIVIQSFWNERQSKTTRYTNDYTGLQKCLFQLRVSVTNDTFSADIKSVYGLSLHWKIFLYLRQHFFAFTISFFILPFQ